MAHPRICVFSYDRISRDLDLDPMTLTHEPDLYIVLKMKFVGQGFQKLEHEQTHTHTDAAERITIAARTRLRDM